MTIPHTLHRPTGPPRPCVEQDPEWSAVRPCGCGGGFPSGEAFGPSRGRPGPETHERPDPPGWSPEPEWLPLRNPCLPVGCGPPGGHGQGNLREEPSARPSRPSPSGQRCPGSDQAMKPDAPPWPDCSTHGFGGAPPPVHPPGPDWVPLGPSVPASMRDGGGSRTHAPPGAPFHSQQRKPGSRAPTSTRTGGRTPPEQPTYQGG